MKGGDVIIIAALKALKAAGVLDDMNLVVVMTGDEEDSGDPQAAARAALVEAAKGAQYALGFEDGPGDPKFAVTARRGTSSWKLRGQGEDRALVADLPAATSATAPTTSSRGSSTASAASSPARRTSRSIRAWCSAARRWRSTRC